MLHHHPLQYSLKFDRLRAHRDLAQQGVGTWTNSNNPQKGEPGQKAKERAAERLQKEEDAKAAAAEAAAAPAEEVATEEAASE